MPTPQASRVPPEQLTAGELALARWRYTDGDELYELVRANQEHLQPWMPWAAHIDRQTQMRFLSESSEGWGRGERFEFAIRDRDRTLAGSVGLIRRIAPGGLEIGYWLADTHTGRGLASLAAAAVADAALSLPDIDHVEIHHDRANTRSRMVAQRLGFRLLGSSAQRPTAPGEAGVEVRWRLDEREFADSAASSMLELARTERHAPSSAGLHR